MGFVKRREMVIICVKLLSLKKDVEKQMKRYLSIVALLTVSLLATRVAASVSDAPAVGSTAPEFSLVTNEGKPASLAEFRGKWVVLYFYPKDFTSGCTLQARNFQRDLKTYEQMNAVILGVSVDSAESHKEFCAKEGLAFKLLSDTDAKVSSDYGSVMEYNGAKLSSRNTFIIDPEGKVAKVFLKVRPAGHSEEVLTALAELQKS